MSFFPVEWPILWLAIFFQNRAVSRASVNADPEKGPCLAQSFSTEVAIESGLYIAAWTQDFRVWAQLSAFLADPATLAKVGQIGEILESWSGQQIWPDPAKPAVWPDLARSGVQTWFWPDPWSEPEIARIARIANFGQSCRICQICGFQDLTWSDQSWVQCAICWALCECVCACGRWTSGQPLEACMFATCIATCTHTNRVKGKLLHVYIFGKIRTVCCRMVNFEHSCALKIIFGISSRYEMLFRVGSFVSGSAFRFVSFVPTPYIFYTRSMVMPIRDGIIQCSVELDTFRLSTQFVFKLSNHTVVEN